MNKQEAKQQIQKLVEKYQRVVETGKVKSYNEAQTRNEFIEPLFEYLGWDMRNLTNDNEVTTEENVSGGRIDLAFRFNNIPVLFLEAKAMKVINYSWNKSVTWAILTDFESIKIFNAEIPPKSISQNLFIEINCEDFISRFDQLWLLSKESFEQKFLDKEAQKWGKLTQRKQVGEKLFEDLMSWRVLLTKDFKKQNNLTEEELDEGVQRILDRLIFIRTAEDRKIEPNVLLNISRGEKTNSYKQLTKVFRDFDDGFNSKLFAPHYCEEWKVSDKTIVEVINGLYETQDGYRYDFSVISADVLGGIYEQYLGHVQGRKSEEKQKSKRKSQGIYYTPKYIVEFIVKETLGEVLKNTKPKEISKIKVLDPACGSGSFLIAAYDKILENLTKQNQQTSLFAKFDILKENIFGVDLDAQAIEIAQLNLLLKVLSQKTKLPTLQHNISSGNSLVSGNAEKLEKYFGSDFREQKAFNFEDEFKEVFKQGGFDVIIGNPPYVDVRRIDSKTKNYIFNHFPSTKNRTNLFAVFIEKGLNLLKTGGRLGFIVPNTILTHSSFKELRNFILSNFTIEIIVNLGAKVFKDAQVDTIILIFKKDKCAKNHQIKIMRKDNLGIQKNFTIKQSDFDKDPEKRFSLISPKLFEIITKIETGKNMLGKFYHGYNGINPGNQRNTVVTKNPNLSDKKFKKIIDGKNISRYLIIWGGEWVFYDRKILERPRDEKIFLANPKIMLQKIGINLVASYDTEQLYSLINTTILIEKTEGYSSLFILAVINSKLLNFYYKNKFLGVQIKTEFLENLPIPKINQAEQEKIAKKAQIMLNLHKELRAISVNTDKHNSLKQEIEKFDNEIDEQIYKIYNLSEEEIKIIKKYGKN
ncbi:MAG: N-6 DNA methylase [Candidatus Parcubacteria bacterium]|nr:N-6 DNA methylase [Candidatus Parcubacteria bacterium]